MYKLILTSVALTAPIACNKLDRPTASSAATNVVSRDLVFSGVQFTPHDSHPLKVALIDRDLDARLFIADVGIASGKFTLTKEKALVDGHRYFLDYYADVNGNQSCDAPTTDHVWRIPIDTVTSNISITDTHKMNFHDSCSSFRDVYAGPTGDMTVLITGRLLLGDSVTDARGITPGQALVGANVFVEGFADQDTVTDSTGAFRLSITMPRDQALLATERRLIMWYTQPKPGKTSADWDLADARFGATKSVALSSNLNIGDQKLQYTKAVNFRVLSSVDQNGISTCWIHSKTLGSNLVIWSGTDGTYTVDYLPPGSYDLAVVCPGYQNATTTVTVGESNARSASDTAPDVILTPTP